MEEDEEEEATVGLAAAEETSVDAAVVEVLVELSIQVVLFFPLRFLGALQADDKWGQFRFWKCLIWCVRLLNFWKRRRIYWPRRQSLMWPWPEKTPFDLQVKSGQLILNDHIETGFSSGQPK